ncbi:MAG: sugar ABC transporter permease [bacterium]|nr:sugar ABC transporter permease [bacterium]
MKRSSLLNSVYKNKFIYLSLVPTFALLLTFNYYPAINALYHSLFEWDGIGYEKFIGIKNFVNLFKDPVFIIALRNVSILAISGVIISITFPLLAAELTFNLRNLKMQYLYRTMFVVPMVVPGIVVLLLWGFIYRPDGLLNNFLTILGLGSLTRPWLGDFNTALFALIFIGFPWIGSFNYLIYLAGLQSINKELFESSIIDGATRLQQIFYIDIPMILGQIKLILILTIIGVMQGYTTQVVLTQGGPGYSTMVPGMYMYNSAFLYYRMGYGCAIGTFLFGVILFLTIVSRRYIQAPIEFGGTK